MVDPKIQPGSMILYKNTLYMTKNRIPMPTWLLYLEALNIATRSIAESASLIEEIHSTVLSKDNRTHT